MELDACAFKRREEISAFAGHSVRNDVCREIAFDIEAVVHDDKGHQHLMR